MPMSTKLQFRIKFFVIVCMNTLFYSVAVSQTEKSSYTPTDKRTKNFKKSGEVVSKPKPKKKSIAKTKNEFGPVKAIFSFFDDSMFEFGPAEITDTYTYDDESMYEFGSAESSSEFYYTFHGTKLMIVN
jgi:hypothetical protein